MSKYAARTSYAPLMERVLRRIRPKRVLEWGPGDSTRIIAGVCPDADIESIEHNSKWYLEAQRTWKDHARVRVHLVPLLKSRYVTEPLRAWGPRSFDFIFVDGRHRCACLVVASVMVRAGGVVMLHDAERARYKPGIDVYPNQEWDDENQVALWW